MASNWGAAFGAAWGAAWGAYGSTPIPPAPVPQDQPISNWQAHHRNIWRRRTKQDDDEERRRLGIIPPEVIEVEEKAAEIVTKAAIDPDIDIQKALENYADLYREAFKGEYLKAAEIERLFREELELRRRHIASRAAWLLLLH